MFESVSVGSGKASVLVVGHFQGEPLDKATRKIDPGGAIAAALKRGEATGEMGRVVEAFPRGKYKRVLLVGMGKRAKFEPSDVRAVAAAAGRRLAVTKDTSAQIELGGPLGLVKVDAARAGQMVGESFGLLGWVCDQFKGKQPDPPKRAKLALMSSERRSAGASRAGWPWRRARTSRARSARRRRTSRRRRTWPSRRRNWRKRQGCAAACSRARTSSASGSRG